MSTDDLRQIIKEELEQHKPVISPRLIQWFIGVFGVFIILLAVNIGMYKIRFSNTEEAVKELNKEAVRRTDYRYQLTEYRTDHMWAEDHNIDPPQPPISTRGGGTSQK